MKFPDDSSFKDLFEGEKAGCDEQDTSWKDLIKGIKPLKNSRHIAPPLIKKIYVNSAVFFEKGPLQETSIRHYSKRDIRNVLIQGALDLHGLTIPEATIELKKFIIKNRGRWVLVITGKGKTSSDGGFSSVLRSFLIHFIEKNQLLFVGYTTAPQHEGGEGAFYIHIRKQRI